jgi:Ferritin-like
MIELQPAVMAGLNQPLPDPDVIRDKLQFAIELEHATIPLYLYALYSLDAQKNRDIARIVQSIVIEEMMHMTLAANVLNAIGGTPRLDHPDFVPKFPGPLPGGVQAQLNVHLAAFSMPQLDVMLEIEQPEHPIAFPAASIGAPPVTIGLFYSAISEAIAAHGPALFVAPPFRQIGPDLMDGAIVVTDVATAQQAIQIIIDQGEGTSTTPLDAVGGDLAHYYRLNQIAKGHRLVPTPGRGQAPEDQYAYSGAPITLDPGGVYPVATDPGPYAPGTAEAAANDNFNYDYTGLLKCLEAMFLGDATTEQMDTALGLMYSLKGQATAMMAGQPDPTKHFGPTFTYQPTNPSA